MGIKGLNVAHGPVEEVLAEYFDAGIYFDSINLDFTGNVSKQTLRPLWDISKRLRQFTILSVTILRGRETPKMWKELFPDSVRSEIAGTAIDQRAFYLSQGIELETDVDALRMDAIRTSLLHWRDGKVVDGWLLGRPRYGIYNSSSGQSMLFFHGVALRYPNVQFMCDYAKRDELGRGTVLDGVSKEEWKNLRIYARYLNFVPQFIGHFR